MRLIDADNLIDFIENRFTITWDSGYEGGIKDACLDILHEIEKSPTIESITEREAWKISDVFQDHYCMGIGEIAEEDETCASLFRKVGLL